MSYSYSIGKYEVTNAQYCQFLNANLPNISDPAPVGINSNNNSTFCPVTRTGCIILPCHSDDGSQCWNRLRPEWANRGKVLTDVGAR